LKFEPVTFVFLLKIFFMQKVIVNIDDPANARLFLKVVRQLNFVESAKIVNAEYNWINPSRPATDEECEQMRAECESEYDAGLFFPMEEVKKMAIADI
jgi:hypothetical protein